jgi:putative spermidine/putrescine transport system substrate-binding protein
MIAYNTKNVSNPPKTYEDLKQWINEHPNKFIYATVPTSGPGRGSLG